MYIAQNMLARTCIILSISESTLYNSDHLITVTDRNQLMHSAVLYTIMFEAVIFIFIEERQGFLAEIADFMGQCYIS